MLRTLLAFFLVSSCAPAIEAREAPNDEKPSPPNIVFIYTDDQAPTAVGASGNSEIRTPHMDRVFREGAHLLNSFVTTPVCSPSRAGLMTSRYGTELGITEWINPRSEKELGLDPAIATWPKALQAAGYRTGLVGKWHLGTADRFHPTKHGYDEFAGFREGGAKPVDPVLEIEGETKKCTGFTADVLTDYAIEFLERHRDRAFALSLHFRAPHSAWLPVAEEDWAPYAELDPALPAPDIPNLDVKRVKRMTREYYASVSSVDRNVGRVLDALDRLGVSERTVVIFTSDHGYHHGHHGLWYKGNAHWMTKPLPPKKWEHIAPRRRPNLFDQALRVPTAVRWPGVVRPGTKIEETVTNLDWFPTLLAIAGVPLPEKATVRGRSFVPLLRGEKVGWENAFYAEYSMRHGSKTHMRSWRTPEWKLIVDFLNPGRVELYDLRADPGELTNVASREDSRTRRARAVLSITILEHMRKIGDPALPLAEGKGVPEGSAGKNAEKKTSESDAE